jgi:hypothetical protein
MFDLTIDSSPEAGGRVRYELGKANWQDRCIPDIGNPSAMVQIPESRLIDVVILGDGYETAASFESLLQSWLNDFSKLTVYETFAGAFRIRALYEPSSEPASSSRDSFYRTYVKSDDSAMFTDESWWSADDNDGQVFRDGLFAAVDSFSGVNLRRYPNDLDLGDGNTTIKNGTLRDVHRNLVVCMLVRSATRSNVSGIARHVPRPDPDDHKQVRVGFGANAIHEFSHAFGYLSDEYIDKNREVDSTRIDHPTKSVFTLSNLGHSTVDGEVAWAHLSPWGRDRRQAAGHDPDPVVGWLWVGGHGRYKGVWHSEYQCLMNGTHDNFKFTQVQADDPTANADGTYDEENGAGLRDYDRFCLWCQEIVTVRILEKTDRLRESGDPSDLSGAGIEWWKRWESELSDKYWALFDVSQQIVDYEAMYAAMNPGRSGEPLWQSDLCSTYTEAPEKAPNPVPDVSDDEIYTLLLSS